MTPMSGRPTHPHEKPHHPHWPLSALLFAVVLGLGLGGVHEPSAWLHVRTGRRILSERALPLTDTFSYGAARARWETDSGLADVLFAKADEIGGPGLVRALTAVAVAAGFVLMLPISNANPLAAAGLLALGAAAAWPGFGESPAAFDFLLFALFVRLLRPRRRFRWSDGAAAAALTALWSNLHGASAPLALLLVFLKAFKASLRSPTREGLGYWVMFFACAVAFSLNPLGYGVLAHAFVDAAPGAAAWPVSLASPAGLLILLGLVSCAFTLQQEFVTTLACASVMALSLAWPGLRPLAALAACPLAALALGHFLPPRADTWGRVLRWGALPALALLALHRETVTRPLAPSGGYGAPALAGAVHYLDSSGVRGQMFNEPAAGVELIGLSERPVFVDERPGLYPESFRAEAEDWPRRLRALDAIYRFDYAVVRNRRASAPARVFDEDPDWRLAYADDRALVYLKRSGADGWLAAQAAFRLVAPNRLWPDALDAALARPASSGAVLEEINRWSLQAPDCVQALLWKAYALERLKMSGEADRLLTLARERPAMAWDPQLQAEAAFVLEARGRAREAGALYRRAEREALRLDDDALAREIEARLARLGPAATAGA